MISKNIFLKKISIITNSIAYGKQIGKHKIKQLKIYYHLTKWKTHLILMMSMTHSNNLIAIHIMEAYLTTKNLLR